MRVMGVDPGLTRCGLSVVETGAGRKVTALDVDVVRTPSTMPLAERLLAVWTAAEFWMDTHEPDVIAVERVFAQHNVSTAMDTAQAGGVGDTGQAAQRAGDIAEQAPRQILGSQSTEYHAEQDSGQTAEQVRLDTDRDKFLTAEEAKEYGIVDTVFDYRKLSAGN